MAPGSGGGGGGAREGGRAARTHRQSNHADTGKSATAPSHLSRPLPLPPLTCRRQWNHADTGKSATAPELPPEVLSGGYMLTTQRRKVSAGRAGGLVVGGWAVGGWVGGRAVGGWVGGWAGCGWVGGWAVGWLWVGGLWAGCGWAGGRAVGGWAGLGWVGGLWVGGWAVGGWADCGLAGWLRVGCECHPAAPRQRAPPTPTSHLRATHPPTRTTTHTRARTHAGG